MIISNTIFLIFNHSKMTFDIYRYTKEKIRWSDNKIYIKHKNNFIKTNNINIIKHYILK